MFKHNKERDEYFNLYSKLGKILDTKPLRTSDKNIKSIENSFHTLVSTLNFEIGNSHVKSYCRGIKAKYKTSPLSIDGSLLTNGRYNFAKDNFGCLYLTEDEAIVDEERQNDVFKKKPPHFKFWVDVKLQNVFNIPLLPLSSTSPFSMDARYVIMELLHREWEFFNNVLNIKSYTQILSKAVFDHGYEAILVPSSRVVTKLNLIVFPKNLLVGSSLSVYDPENELGNEPKANIIEGYCIK